MNDETSNRLNIESNKSNIFYNSAFQHLMAGNKEQALSFLRIHQGHISNIIRIIEEEFNITEKEPNEDSSDV